jgi:hypothetical protein
MAQFRVHLSPGWLLVAIVIIGVNLASVRMALQWKGDWIPGKTTTIRLDYLHDGSVVKYIYHNPGKSGPFLDLRSSGPVLVRPISALGLWRVWWPVAASV